MTITAFGSIFPMNHDSQGKCPSSLATHWSGAGGGVDPGFGAECRRPNTRRNTLTYLPANAGRVCIACRPTSTCVRVPAAGCGLSLTSWLRSRAHGAHERRKRPSVHLALATPGMDVCKSNNNAHVTRIHACTCLPHSSASLHNAAADLVSANQIAIRHRCMHPYALAGWVGQFGVRHAAMLGATHWLPDAASHYCRMSGLAGTIDARDSA